MSEHTHAQVAVSYTNGIDRYYPIPEGQGWRLDTMDRTLVIGKGLPRVHVPLDNVICFELIRYPCKDDSCPISQSTAIMERWQTGTTSTPASSPPSTDPSPSEPMSGSSGQSMSLKTESAMVLTTTSGYRAALRHYSLGASTQWSRLSPSMQRLLLGYLTYHGLVLSSHPLPHPPDQC